MKITIQDADNGWIVYDENNKTLGTEDFVPQSIMAFEGEDEDFKRVLEYLFYQFCRPYDKYKSDNINITFDKKGHKVD